MTNYKKGDLKKIVDELKTRGYRVDRDGCVYTIFSKTKTEMRYGWKVPKTISLRQWTVDGVPVVQVQKYDFGFGYHYNNVNWLVLHTKLANDLF